MGSVCVSALSFLVVFPFFIVVLSRCFPLLNYVVFAFVLLFILAGRLGSSEVPRNPLTRWDVSSIPANGIFLT